MSAKLPKCSRINNALTSRARGRTIAADDAARRGLGPLVIRHGHGVHAALRPAVPVHLERRLPRVHADVHAGPGAGALEASGGAAGQRHSVVADAAFGLPFPGHGGDLLQGPVLDPGPQHQTGVRHHVHRLLVEDVHRHAPEPTGH